MNNPSLSIKYGPEMGVSHPSLMLDFVAKAHGNLEYIPKMGWHHSGIVYGTNRYNWWDPLSSDHDAFELMVMFGIQVGTDYDLETGDPYQYAGYRESLSAEYSYVIEPLLYDEDARYITRLVIVRCVFEIVIAKSTLPRIVEIRRCCSASGKMG